MIRLGSDGTDVPMDEDSRDSCDSGYRGSRPSSQNNGGTDPWFENVRNLQDDLAHMHVESRIQSRSSSGGSVARLFGACPGTSDADAILALEMDEEDEGVDENDCESSFVRMPPPRLPIGKAARVPFGVLSNRPSFDCSPVSRKGSLSGGGGAAAARNILGRATSTNSFLPQTDAFRRGRKRATSRAESADEPCVGNDDVKRGRHHLDHILEHHELEPSTSTSTCSMMSSSAAPHQLQRAQSTFMLERGEYSHTHFEGENTPALLEVNYRLSIMRTVDSQAYRRISGETLVQEWSRIGEDAFRSMYQLVDCRYPFEYNGGHIKGAMNVYDPQLIEQLFFSEGSSNVLTSGERAQRRIPIFYCEFSQKRGPTMASSVRAFDRIKNQLNYPSVDHAEMYVLNGGYKEFHAQFGCEELCSPRVSYTPMLAPEFAQELKKYDQHKKSYSGTTSRLPYAATAFERQRRRAEQDASGSPSTAGRILGRKISRRGLLFLDPNVLPSTPPHRPIPIANPHFS